MTKSGETATLVIPDHGDVKRALLAKLLKVAGIPEDVYVQAFNRR
jgi:hypothetical protein